MVLYIDICYFEDKFKDKKTLKCCYKMHSDFCYLKVFDKEMNFYLFGSSLNYFYLIYLYNGYSYTF